MRSTKPRILSIGGGNLPFIIALIAVVVLILYFVGNQNTLDAVVVSRTGDDAVNYVSDETIIRESGLELGSKIGDLAEIQKIAEKGVNALGFVALTGVERTGKHEITLNVNVRKPFALLDVGGNLVLIDDEGCVMAHPAAMPTYAVMYVSGAEITEHREGRRVVAKRQKQVDDILTVVGAIRELGYQATFTELNVKDPYDMYLVTNTHLIVRFYETEHIHRTLDMIMGMIADGVTEGRVSISGVYGDLEVTQTQVNASD